MRYTFTVNDEKESDVTNDKTLLEFAKRRLDVPKMRDLNLERKIVQDPTPRTFRDLGYEGRFLMTPNTNPEMTRMLNFGED